VLAAVLAPGAIAQHQKFVVNPDASEVKITLKTTHELVNGAFHVQSGSIEFDRDNSKMLGSVVVLAGSCKTGNDSRDNKMNKDILRVEQFATISFEPKSYSGVIAPSGESNLQLTVSSHCSARLTRFTIPILVHVEAQPQRPRLILSYLTCNGIEESSFLIWKADNDVAIDLFLDGRLSEQERASF